MYNGLKFLASYKFHYQFLTCRHLVHVSRIPQSGTRVPNVAKEGRRLRQRQRSKATTRELLLTKPLQRAYWGPIPARLRAVKLAERAERDEKRAAYSAVRPPLPVHSPTDANLDPAIIYVAPCGRKLRDMHDVSQYLRDTESSIPIDSFSFSPQVDPFRVFEAFQVH